MAEYDLYIDTRTIHCSSWPLEAQSGPLCNLERPGLPFNLGYLSSCQRNKNKYTLEQKGYHRPRTLEPGLDFGRKEPALKRLQIMGTEQLSTAYNIFD